MPHSKLPRQTRYLLPRPRTLSLPIRAWRPGSGLQSEQGVYLTWLTPKGSGGPVDDYEVMRVVADEDDLEVAVPASSTNNGRTFYNDDDTQASIDNKERRYRVRAVNEEGESAWTDWVAYPLADHTHAPVVTELTAPPSVTVSQFEGHRERDLGPGVDRER